MFVTTIGLVAAGVGLLYVWLVWNYGYWRQRGVPGPGATVVAGSFPQAFLQRRNVVYEIEEQYKKYRGKTPFIGIFTGRTPNLMLLDPAYIKTAMTTNFKQFHDTDLGMEIDKDSDPLLSRNPFMLTGEEWKEKRAEITPAFTSTKLKTMYPIMEHVCGKMTAHLNADGLIGTAIDAKELASKFTADVVANCIYGIDSGAFTQQRSAIRDMGSSIFALDTVRLVYLTAVQVLPALGRIYKMPFVSKKVERFFEKVTHDAIRMRLESGQRRDDFLNYLLQLRERKPTMTDIDLTAHTMTFFIDGFETSSNVIAWALLNLAGNAEAQRRLREEIEKTVGADADAAVSFEQINDMTYLDQVVNETLRHTPVAAFLARKCTEATELVDYEGKRLKIDVGTSVHVPLYSIHRDPEFYPEPERFRPERFDEERGGVKKFKDAGQWLSFGDGPRQCLGMKFGVMQVKTALVELVRRFEVRAAEKMPAQVELDPRNFLLMPVGGIWVELHAVKKAK